MKDHGPTVLIGVLPDASLEAIAVRAVLEAGGRRVDLRFIATPEQFRQIVAPQPVPDLLVICGHGADGTLHFGPLPDSAGGHELTNGYLAAERFAGHVTLPGCTVLCTACDSATAGLAEAFVKGGAVAYLAPAGEPDGHDMLLAAHHVLHALQRGLDAQAAMAVANAALAGALTLRLHHGVAHAAA